MAMMRVGQQIGGSIVLGRIATGTYGEVLRAIDVGTGAVVALKLQTPRGRREDPRGFQREARLCASLCHDNVLPLLGRGSHHSTPYLVFPLARESLSQRLERPMSVAQALDVLSGVLEGLVHLHARGVIHCDLKPSNILVMPDGRPCIADFGAARRGRSTVRSFGSGTPGYMAPEQRDGHPCPRSDLYALACVAHEALTGVMPTLPYEGGLRAATGRARLPAGLEAWLEHALQEDPAERTPRAECMLEELTAIRRRRARPYASAGRDAPRVLELAG